VKRPAISPWLALAFVFVGLFGTTVAVSGLWAPLPPPRAGGTCGPGLGSEAAIAALVNPNSIGAGAEPPATNAAARAQWSQFVRECQTATDDRALVTIPLLIVSLGLGVAGLVLLWKRLEHPTRPAPLSGDRQWWSSPPPPAPPHRSPPFAPSQPVMTGSSGPPGGSGSV
jgi:hypothetical protein